MTKRIFVYLTTLFFIVSVLADARQRARIMPLELVGLWWCVESEWVTPPPEVGLDEREASATILLFCPDGKFRMYECGVVEHRGIISIVTDAINIYEGKWKRTYGEVSIKYRLISATILPVGGLKLPGKWQKEKGILLKGAIRFKDKNFTEFISIHPKDYEDWFFCVEK